MNTAARVEGANRQFGTRLLVSETVVEALGDRLEAEPRPPIELSGKTGVHTLYSVVGVQP